MKPPITKEIPARIITRETRHASEEAGKLISSARYEAGKIIKAAEEDAFQIREEAYKNGYEKGRQQTMSMILEAVRYREHLEQSAQSEMIDLCLMIVRKLVAVHLKDYPQWITDRVRHGLKILKDQRSVKIRISPDDWEACQECIGAMVKNEKSGASICILSDESLTRGDCVFESQCGDLDGRITNSMEWLTKHLSDFMSEQYQKGADYAEEPWSEFGSRNSVRIE